MYTFAFLLLCVQACLVQNVYSQCCRSPAPSCGQAYGGQGIGDVSVSGELPVCGTTQLCGQVPILGAVDFGGKVQACGDVTIAGKCAECGCKGSYAY